MCGPIIAAFSAARRSGGGGARGLIIPTTLYHAGRISSYAILGALFGVAGTVVGALGPTRIFQGVIALLAGGTMLAIGFSLLGALPVKRWIEGMPLAGGVFDAMRRLIGASSPAGWFGLGAANGFLPCGPVIAVAAGATAAGSVPLGALTMVVYGAGTVPALVLLGFGASALSAPARGRLYRFGAAAVLIVALQLMLRGMSALGAFPHARIGPVVLW